MIRFCDASPNLGFHLATPPSLEEAVALVIAADDALGRNVFSIHRTQIVQIPPSDDSGPRFCCIFPQGRDERPFNANEDGASHDPLSLEAVRQSGQSYFAISAADVPLLLLSNPFAYAPRCVTWAALEMLEQTDVGTRAAPWRRILNLMQVICRSLGGDIVGLNAVGNSMKRMHLVSHRQPEGIGPYALQQAASRIRPEERASVARISRDSGYPLDVWRFGFAHHDESVEAAAALLDRWTEVGGPYATATVAAAFEEGRSVLYVAPRNRLLSPFGWPGMAAVMEILGAGVSSRTDFIERVRGGIWGYEHFKGFLSSLSPRRIELLY